MASPTDSTTGLPWDPPDYMEGFPNMKGFVSTSDFDLGWLTELHRTAASAIKQIFSSLEIKLDAEDPFKNVKLDSIGDAPAPLVYVVVWLIIAVLFTFTGMCWCCFNKCCCCCKSGFRGKGRVGDIEHETNPNFAERNDSKNENLNTRREAIVLTVMMAVWLIILLWTICYTFGGSEETNKAIANFEVDIDNGFADAENFIETAAKQVIHLLVEGFIRFEKAVEKTIRSCIDNSDKSKSKSKVDFCEELKNKVGVPLNKTRTQFEEGKKGLEKGLKEGRKAVDDVKSKIDDKYKDVVADVNAKLYIFFTIFNIIYLIILVLVVIGMVLAVFARTDELKTNGYLTIRGAIVLMFMLVLVIIIQLLILFIIGGVVTQIICPFLRDLETVETHKNGGRSSNQVMRNGRSETSYAPPTYGEIMRSCKKDKTVYEAFNLVSAYDIKQFRDILADYLKLFELIPAKEVFPPIPPPTTISPHSSRPERKFNPKETVEEIARLINHYVDFVTDAVENHVARCKPVHDAADALVGLICEKITAPIVAFWFILQFLPPLFAAIIITALFFERLHF